MNIEPKKVWVVGHKNPDTDSICAAISYAYLKNQLGERQYVPKRAGAISEETRYVLDYFKVEDPELITDVGAQLKDISIRKTAGISSQISLKKAWETMKKLDVVTLPVTNRLGKLEGVIVTKDIATSYMDVYDNRVLSKARTQYKNIAETLDGNIIAGNEHAYFIRGKVVVGASDLGFLSEYIEADDMVILGPQKEVQIRALESNASCIIVGCGFEVDPEVIQMANKKDCVIITTPYDTFSIARLINQSMPISHFMKKDGLVTFKVTEKTEDIRGIMGQKRYRDFPILDQDGNYLGMISRRNLLNLRKKRVILVDHNEASQTVDGIAYADILEIIDHHRIGTLETLEPVYFRNQPVGCTATIVYQMYQENRVQIPKNIAGLLMAAIISDTLMFRSPTCTAVDKAACLALAQIAGLDIEKYAIDMFSAGSNLKGKSDGDIFYQDFKRFTVGNSVFGIGQITSLNAVELKDLRSRMSVYTEKEREQHEIDMMFFMLTNILTESTDLICTGQGAEQLITTAFHVADEDVENVSAQTGIVKLPGVVSRKKQLAPQIMMALQQ